MNDADAAEKMEHLCSFYQTDAELVAALAHILRLRLKTGRHVIYVADTDSAETAWSRLDQTGMDLSDYRSSGRLDVVPTGIAFWGTDPVSSEALLDYLQRAAAAAQEQGSRGVCLISEKSWCLAQGLSEAELFGYEGRVNALSPHIEFELCCLYDQRRFSGEALLEALRTHPLVLRNNSIFANPSYLPPSDYFAPQRNYREFERKLQQLEAGNVARPDFDETDIRRLLDKLPLLIHTHDAAGNYTFWNAESERVLGYTEDEVVGDAQIRSKLFPDAAYLAEVNKFVAQNDLNSFSSNVDVEYTAKDGTKRIIQFSRRIAPPRIAGWRTLDAGVDVTNCRAVQGALAASRRELDLIIENVHARFCLVDKSLRYCFVNSLYASWYGKRPEEVIGSNIRQLLSPEYFELVYPYIQRSMSGEKLEYEISGYSAFGEKQYFCVHQGPYSFSTEAIEGIVVMIIDISEQKHAEMALQESELRFRTYLEDGADAVLLLDLGGTVRDVNRRTTEYLGYSHEQLRGMKVTDLDVRMRQPDLERFVHNLKMEKRIRYETALLRRDGALLPVETHCSLITLQGEMLALAQVRDISERLRARVEREELLTRFRVIFENSLDGILAINMETQRFSYANPAISTMLGYKIGAFRSLKLADLIDPASFSEASGTDDPVAYMLASRTDVCLLRKNGERFYADTNGAKAFIDGRDSIILFIRDASPRRAHAEQLRRSYEFQAKLFEVCPDTIVRLDPQGQVLHVSPRCRELFGIADANDLIGHTLKNWLEPDEFARAADNFDRVKKLQPGDINPPNRYKLQRKDQNECYGSFHSAPLYGENGELDSVISVIRDVTEEVKAAEALRRTLEFQTRIMEASPDAITRLDIQGRIEFVSLQGCRLFGGTEPEAFIGSRAHDWIDPADHERLDANIADLIRVGKGWKHSPNEYRFMPRNAEPFICAISSAPLLDDTGEVAGIVAIVRDVSEQKNIENQLRVREKKQRELVESLHEGLEVIDRSGRILFVNRKLCELLGYTREELLGRRFVDLVSPEDRKHFLSQVIKRKITSVQRYEIVFPRKDGMKRIFLVTHHPRTDDGGELIGSFGVISDITEEKQLQRMKEDVDRLIRNELRTPLKGIISLTHLMLMDKTGSRCADYATELNGIAANLLRFIDLSREIFQMERGDYEPEFAWFDFRRIFRNISRFINPEAEVNLVRVIYHNDPQSGLGKLQHYGEQVLLESMLVNLIKNAVESSRPKDEVTVIFECTEQEVQISVHNYGYIPQEQLSMFFEKYVAFGKNEGAWLGRYSAKLIAEAHGGNITVDSDREKGTVVSILLPRLSPDS